jgi:hypothetical protein
VTGNGSTTVTGKLTVTGNAFDACFWPRPGWRQRLDATLADVVLGTNWPVGRKIEQLFVHGGEFNCQILFESAFSPNGIQQQHQIRIPAAAAAAEAPVALQRRWPLWLELVWGWLTALELWYFKSREPIIGFLYL